MSRFNRTDEQVWNGFKKKGVGTLLVSTFDAKSYGLFRRKTMYGVLAGFCRDKRCILVQKEGTNSSTSYYVKFWRVLHKALQETEKI